MNEKVKHISQKVEKVFISDLSLEEATKDIEYKLDILGVDRDKFSNTFDELLKKLFRFLLEYEIKFEDFAAPDRLLRGLCLVDMWISITSQDIKEVGKLKSFRKLKSTIDRFKLICIAGDYETKHVQLSQKVLHESRNGNKRSGQFDPNAEVKDSGVHLLNTAIRKVMKNHVDEDKSSLVNQYIFEIFPEMEALLKSSNEYKKYGKLPFEVKMLNITTEELMGFPVSENVKLECTAFINTNYNTGVQNIYLCENSLNIDQDAMHEFIHSLSYKRSQGIQEGYNWYLGKGMNEAMTENRNVKKLCYPYPRYVLDLILADKKELESLAYNVYFGDESRDKLTTAIFNLYGSEGVIKFDFMISLYADQSDKLGSSILFNFEECLEFFAKGIEEPYLKSLQQTIKLQKKYESIYLNICKSLENNSEKRESWRKSFGKLLFYISDSLDEILKFNRELPLRDLLNSETEFDQYNRFLQALDDFDYADNQESNQKLVSLEERANNWEGLIKKAKKTYWSKYHDKPLFERLLNSEYTSEALKNALTALNLIHNKKVKFNPSLHYLLKYRPSNLGKRKINYRLKIYNSD